MVKKMVILPIKKKWFDMILSGEKKEEYREIKPYYDTRLLKEFGLFKDGDEIIKGNTHPQLDLSKKIIRFRNGYSSNSPYFDALCTLSIGIGNTEWEINSYK